MIPIGDSPNPRGFVPWVTWLLLAANVGIYLLVSLPLSLQGLDPNDPLLQEYLRVILRDLPGDLSARQVVAQLSAYDLYVFRHGYKPGAPEVADLFYAMFLHGGLAHLGGNMLFLWIYGDNVEHRLGRLHYLVAYLAGGVAATLGFSLLAGDSLVPMVGASGAISAVLGLYFVMFGRNVVKVLVLLFPFLVDIWLVPARIVIGLFVVIDNLLPLLGGVSTGVAYGAHLGGFFAGLAWAFVGERLGWGGAPGAERPAPSEGVDDVLEHARRLEDAGRPGAAHRVLRERMGRVSPAERQRLHLAMGELLVREGQHAAAFQHLAQAAEHGEPEVRQRARRALSSLPLDPRLARRFDLPRHGDG